MSPVARAADDDASVGPITEGAKPVASAADASLLFANGLVMLGPPLPPLRSAQHNDQ